MEDEAIGATTHVIELGGELDFDAAPVFKERLIELIDTGKRHIVVDLSQSSFVGSTALGVLVGALKRLRREGGSLPLVCRDESILRSSGPAGSTAAYRSTQPAMQPRRRFTPAPAAKPGCRGRSRAPLHGRAPPESHGSGLCAGRAATPAAAPAHPAGRRRLEPGPVVAPRPGGAAGAPSTPPCRAARVLPTLPAARRRRPGSGVEHRSRPGSRAGAMHSVALATPRLDLIAREPCP